MQSRDLQHAKKEIRMVSIVLRIVYTIRDVQVSSSPSVTVWIERMPSSN